MIQRENLEIERERLEVERQKLEFERTVGSQLLNMVPAFNEIFERLVTFKHTVYMVFQNNVQLGDRSDQNKRSFP